MKQKINYGTLIDGEKYYPVTYSITQDGKKIFKKGKLKGCDLTENQIHELLSNSKSKIVISHGGKRIGAGAKKKKKSEKKEPTKVIRVPLSKLKEVMKIVNREP